MVTISIRVVVAALLTITVLGCDDEVVDTTEQQRAAEETAEVAAEAAEEVEEAAEEAPAGLEGVENALEEAAEVAAESEGEGTLCEQALSGMLAMRSQLEESLGAGDAPPLDESGFLTACQQLPEGAQQCMVMSYAMSHREECTAFQEQIRNAAPR